VKITRPTIKIIVFLLGSTSLATAQNTPNSNTAPAPVNAGNIALVPSMYPVGAPVNFIRSWSPQIPLTTNSDVININRTVEEVPRTTQYLDGLGRPSQAVNWQGSPAKKDMVSVSTYDVFGREAFQYRPFIANAQLAGDIDNDGNLKSDPFQQQAAFMQNQFPGEQVYYGKTIYETSPLSRPLKVFAIGNSWAGSENAGANEHAVTIAYTTNTADDQVRIWFVDNSPLTYTNNDQSTNVPYTNSVYAAGLLLKTVTKDEAGHAVIEYKNPEGLVVLKKVQAGTVSDNAPYTNWLSTYYIYDDFNQLRVVLQPRAVEELVKPANNWIVPADVLNEFGFRYEYDKKHRMTAKKVPGAGWVYMVYDARDRQVMTQDANMRQNNQWLFSAYDELNRPKTTGIITSASTHTQLQAAASTSTNYPSYTSMDILTETYYDSYSWVPSGIAGVSATLDNTFTSGSGYISSTNTAPYYAQAIAQSPQTAGLVTGSKQKIIGLYPVQYVYTVNFYDDRGRVIQSRKNTHTGGSEIITNQYDFAGKVLRTHQRHQYKAADPVIEVLSMNSYDHAGRITKIQKQINNGTIKTIVQNEYDALGQLKTKKLGNKPNSTEPLETLDYTYNIRGWLTGINRGLANEAYSAEHTAQEDRWFGMQLNYDYGFTDNQFNGNIAGTVWKTKGHEKGRAYGFAYDVANRLLKGDFTQQVNTTT